MLASSKELKNIPVALSILHEQEYNICLFIKSTNKGGGERKRRAFSEKNKDISSDICCHFLDHSRSKLKNK